MRDAIGIGTLMWGSDYPHTESTFPRSQELLGGLLAEVPAEEADAMVCRNTAALYGLSLPTA
jgi:predicted TIM-barrel fold metal-dependent hydrolase